MKHLNLCISILEFKVEMRFTTRYIPFNLCISILEFKVGINQRSIR